MRVLLLALLLTGCTVVERSGPDEQGYVWTRDGPRGAPFVHKDQDVYLRCGLQLEAKACSRIEDGRCDVYLPEDPKPWWEPHELKHCDGWTHR